MIFLAVLYLSKFPITSVFPILHKVESREPAISTSQCASTACAHNRQAASSRDAGLHNSTKPVASEHVRLQSCYIFLAMLQKWVSQHHMRYVDKLSNVWLTDRRSLITLLIGEDLGWVHELWPDVVILEHFSNSPMFYRFTELLVHTFSYFIWCFI